ncbi:oligoendopeptidase F [Spiroplasma endosymbiont of Labia minor]|uniref:oligoendopeptidase F n=1 Tax=Spiroplasma endosymbiont of Labia minor TaxID=3066305 RepID=UPI0030CFEE77
MKRSEAQEKYKWDFSHLYKNSDEWKADLIKVEKMCEEYKTFKNKLDDFEIFKKYLDLENETDKLFAKLAQYLHLADIDQTNNEFKELEIVFVNAYQKINQYTSFIAPQLKSIGEQKIMQWLNSDQKYYKYIYGMKDFFEHAKHILSDHDEELLSKVSRSRSSIDGMYDSLAYADRQEELINYDGVEQPLTTTLFMKIMEDSDPIKDQMLRREVSQIYSKNFSTKKHTFAKIYDSILQSTKESLNLRNWNNSLEAALASDKVSSEIYKNLLLVGKKFIDPFKKYNLLIKEKFGFDKFYVTDRQLKLTKEYNKKFTVEQAQDIIKKSLLLLGDEYLQKLAIAWSDNRIDYFEDTNKRDGAYSSGGSGVDPVILMNWDDKLNSVNTLAHESGHSVHTLLANENQPYPLSEYPIILAEVASTINEHLLFDYLYSETTDKNEKIYLLQQRIFDLSSTFYRQIQFADFEYRAHMQVEQDVPQTADSLAALFKDVELDYGYDIFEKTDKLSYGWPRISHFFHSPFYVYKYAIDCVASFKLFNDIKNGNKDNLLNFLKAGGHKPPLEILKDAGVDFSKDETYLPLINAIDQYINQLKELIIE